MINDNEQEDERTRSINDITEAADLLLARDQPEIYDTERELLIRQYQRTTGDTWNDPDPVTEQAPPPEASDNASWHYRWSDARDGGDMHGPYDAGTMKAWSDAGYFGEGVEFRKLGDNEWTRIPDFV